MEDLRKFEKTKPAKTVIHPLYDNFGEIISKEEARTIIKGKTGTCILVSMRKSCCSLVSSGNTKDWIF